MSNGTNSMRAWSVGLDMAYAAGGMLLLGALIDWLAGTRPWWMLGLGLLGLAVGMYRFIRDAMRINTDSATPRRRSNPATPPSPRSTPNPTKDRSDGPPKGPSASD